MTEDEVKTCIEGCKKKDRQSQQRLYQEFHAFAMSICLRYAANAYEAADMLNDGFFKIFTRIHTFDNSRAFQPWLGRVICNTAIDFYRANFKKQQTVQIEKAAPAAIAVAAEHKPEYADLLAMVQRLPLTYRTVFNLYAMDGFSHEEIGAMLNITAGTSRSNLFKARQLLREMLRKAGDPGGQHTSDTPVVMMKSPAADPALHPNYRKS